MKLSKLLTRLPFLASPFLLSQNRHFFTTTANRYFSTLVANKQLTSELSSKQSDNVSQSDVDHLQSFIDLYSGDRLLVLTGAGISTESGIPDYRSPGVGLYTRDGGGYKPMTALTFLNSSFSRKRYWARSFLAWQKMFGASPNSGHLALARWQQAGHLGAIVTQNVDRLHQKAGSEKVIELHGSLYTVRCLSCNKRMPRTLMQQQMEELNSNLLVENKGLLKKAILESDQNKDTGKRLARPDGDIDLNQKEYQHFVESFQVPNCEHCDYHHRKPQNHPHLGILKPDIVFFGENVSRTVVEEIGSLVEQCSGLLVLGSSLAVFSSYRFVVQAASLKKPLMMVNIGQTRADKLDGVVRLDAKLGNLLPKIVVGERKVGS